MPAAAGGQDDTHPFLPRDALYPADELERPSTVYLFENQVDNGALRAFRAPRDVSEGSATFCR